MTVDLQHRCFLHNKYDNLQASLKFLDLKQDQFQIFCVLDHFDCNNLFVLAYDFLSKEQKRKRSEEKDLSAKLYRPSYPLYRPPYRRIWFEFENESPSYGED